jgi:hypothetical protein
MEFQATEAYWSLGRSRTLYKIIRLYIVEKDKVTERMKPNVCKVLWKNVINLTVIGKAYGLKRFQDRYDTGNGLVVCCILRN